MARARFGLTRLRQTLRHYYESDSHDAHRFRYALLAFDIFTILFIVVTSFTPRGEVVEWLDIMFGLVILTDFAARLIICPRPLREFIHPATWADIAAIVSFLA